MSSGSVLVGMLFMETVNNSDKESTGLRRVSSTRILLRHGKSSHRTSSATEAGLGLVPPTRHVTERKFGGHDSAPRLPGSGARASIARILVGCLLAWTLAAQVPGIISHQGKLMVQGVNFSGTAMFKFALVNASGDASYWSHDGTSTGGGEPTGTPIQLSVNRGIFSVNLGDTSIPNMIRPITPDVFNHESVWLRVWVNDGVNGFERLVPDRRITSAAYAMVAGSVVVPGMVVVSGLAQDPTLLGNGYQMVMTVPAPSWRDGMSVEGPSARAGHSAIWDGQRMIVWGGLVADGIYVDSGAMYRPESDSWTAMNTVNGPSPRSEHTAVWTDTEMIVWGGVGAGGPLNTGARFTPTTQSWKPVTSTGAPAERRGHVAVWTGNRMLVWGGRNNSGLLNDGALYDPLLNRWTPLTLPNPPEARFGATAVWAGDRFLVWGGTGEVGELESGGQLLFSGGTPSQWLPISLIGAPSARSGHTAVWTGTALAVWGGQHSGTVLGDGALYSPQINGWKSMSPTDAPLARTDHVAVWTGTEMIIATGAGATGDLATGAAYNPASDQWRALSTSGGPVPRSHAVAVWNGFEIMVFGGLSGGQRIAVLQRLVPQPNWYFYRKL